MILTNQRLDKLAAITVEFRACRMLDNSVWAGHIDPPATKQPQNAADKDDDGEAIDDRNVIAETKLAVDPIPDIPHDVGGVSAWLGIPHLSNLISQFITCQEHARDSETNMEYHVNALWQMPRPNEMKDEVL
ncbi:hypothetical protein JOM56_013455 [Amanita muscaria]